MYFLTLQDPNYMVKGSRDPLGFQVAWQGAGRHLIPELSTVSSSLRDFHIIGLANACKGEFDITDRDYPAFFLCLEQLMAYARLQKFAGEEGFNGIDRARKMMDDSRDHVEISVSNQLLSNQRSYGIWGKYSRPFNDMGLANDARFQQVQLQKLKYNPLLEQLVSQLAKKRGTSIKVKKSDVGALATPLSISSADERDCYIDHLLTDTCHGQLLDMVKSFPELVEMEFYERLDFIIDKAIDRKLAQVLFRIKNTERILSPLNRIFRYLQCKSSWTDGELASDEFIGAWAATFEGHENSYLSPEIGRLLGRDNLETVRGLVLVNETVCARRRSEPWMRFNAAGLEVNHFEGAFFSSDYDPMRNHDYTYFINTWFNLFKQLN
ncbi:hypothetical protein GM921_09605 [Pedobacter sp. LMG 31464]|uniref:Uncharacterized protein n=1 Tax=Pedobacter planticolens TaxID=2679964 RepID=A0A923IV84_9SPHI|nr:hypothetical protein [Pedobacter planticolens]MBB2145741.1 hypothetical protein [Pedobacter planticolens]